MKVHEDNGTYELVFETKEDLKMLTQDAKLRLGKQIPSHGLWLFEDYIIKLSKALLEPAELNQILEKVKNSDPTLYKFVSKKNLNTKLLTSSNGKYSKFSEMKFSTSGAAETTIKNFEKLYKILEKKLKVAINKKSLIATIEEAKKISGTKFSFRDMEGRLFSDSSSTTRISSKERVKMDVKEICQLLAPNENLTKLKSFEEIIELLPSYNKLDNDSKDKVLKSESGGSRTHYNCMANLYNSLFENRSDNDFYKNKINELKTTFDFSIDIEMNEINKPSK